MPLSSGGGGDRREKPEGPHEDSPSARAEGESNRLTGDVRIVAAYARSPNSQRTAAAPADFFKVS